MFCCLLPSSNDKEHDYTITSPEALSSAPVKPLLDEPLLLATIDTGYKTPYSVTCVSEKQVWVFGDRNTMKLLSLRGKLLSSIKTKSRNWPQGIVVTRDGYLIYTDSKNNTVNLVKNKKIRTVTTLQGWKPLSVCRTSSEDLLVTMISDDGEPSKVVRYSGSTQKQTIQFDDQGRPLYTSGGSKYVSENRNLDICVSDCEAGAVVVVNQSGQLRFIYTGHPSNTQQSYYPFGLTTNSQGHILVATNGCIHILDQDGQFLRYILNLHAPRGLCVDIRDNLFVAECGTGKVKKIQYLST
jgi:DNA-binding beta-propeller fold protein YncE